MLTEVTIGFGFQKLTVGNTAVGVTIPTGANSSAFPKALFVTVEVDEIRFRYDGGNPTATDGHKIAVASSFRVEGYENIINFRMIRVTLDATTHVTFER